MSKNNNHETLRRQATGVRPSIEQHYWIVKQILKHHNNCNYNDTNKRETQQSENLKLYSNAYPYTRMITNRSETQM